MKTMRTRGMSLLEITIAMAILGVLMVLSIVVSQRMTDASEVQGQMGASMKTGNSIVKDLTTALQPALIPAFNLAGDNALLYLVPVDHDGDGDTLSNSMTIEWGCIRPNESGDQQEFLDKSWVYNTGTEAWGFVSTDQTFSTKIAFVKTGSFVEADREIDLNQDGDLADVFAIGKLQQTWSEGRVLPSGSWQDEVVKDLTPARIVQVEGSAQGDVDGNGTPEPLFLVSGSYLQITLFLTDVTAKQPVLVKVTGGIEMRNM